jgi:hypothetical protein
VKPWVWLALTGDGRLATWEHDDGTRPPHALRADRRLVDGSRDDDLTYVSYCTGTPLAFDDPIVQGALRRRLALPWPGACSTLLVDWARIGGSITAGRREAAVRDDPFAAAFRDRRLLRVEPGTLARMPAPVGPGITRYGSGNPWPWDRYAGQVQ